MGLHTVRLVFLLASHLTKFILILSSSSSSSALSSLASQELSHIPHNIPELNEFVEQTWLKPCGLTQPNAIRHASRPCSQKSTENSARFYVYQLNAVYLRYETLFDDRIQILYEKALDYFDNESSTEGDNYLNPNVNSFKSGRKKKKWKKKSKMNFKDYKIDENTEIKVLEQDFYKDLKIQMRSLHQLTRLKIQGVASMEFAKKRTLILYEITSLLRGLLCEFEAFAHENSCEMHPNFRNEFETKQSLPVLVKQRFVNEHIMMIEDIPFLLKIRDFLRFWMGNFREFKQFNRHHKYLAILH